MAVPGLQPMFAAILKCRAEPIRRPLSVEMFRDGGRYQIDAPHLVRTNLFLRVGRVDEVFVKVPSARGMGDYRKFVKLAHSCPQDIRRVEESERFENVATTLQAYPGLKQLIAVDAEVAHYLGVHKLQYERLRGQTAVEIPRARFGLLRSNARKFFRSYEPALFQERIRGTPLWSMFDFSTERILARWEPFLSIISAQLSELLDAGLINHIDWNIKNFVFDEEEQRLFYVDLKPTTFIAKNSNEQNLDGIRQYFLL
jgi:hypothetical protein